MPSLTDDDGNVIELDAGNSIVSREAIGMYRKDTKIYKIYNNNDGARRLEEQWVTADRDWGLPTPNIRFFHASYRDDVRPLPRDAKVLEMKAVDTTNFFQMSHGGEARLRGWITPLRDKEVLKRIKRALTAAKNCGIMDPQGFYLAGNSNPIQFIDIHTRAEQNNDFDVLIELVEGMLA